MERCDIYDKHCNRTGKSIVRGEKLKEGEYRLFAHMWLINSEGEILIQKRSEQVNFAPGLWAVTGGGAIQGEDSIDAAYREAKEELGIDIDIINKPMRYIKENTIIDIYIVQYDKNIDNKKLQKEEVSDVKWVTVDELKQMIQEGEFFKSSDGYYELLSKHISI
ncbi:NUDIX hydrolase [Vallitalea longa]|uniref:NUDIX hydrolase n=1 Tax=Vallitalea longa TaxID=2936439 RepID=A0A9W6DFK1_9FIRM|nr:NUDIX domain-containing protein [Vallitalea longa]GKX30675.1 NUDIX hydrolase [Vallitalea longa]